MIRFVHVPANVGRHDRRCMRQPTGRVSARSRTPSAVSAGIVGILVLALAGCASASPGVGGPTTSAPATSTPSPTIAAACPLAPSQGPWGSVIAKEQITDVFGTYCRTTIDPASEAAQFDVAKVDLDSLKTHGFTLDDARKAQKVAVTYLAEQLLDSSRLDDYSVADNEWFEANNGSFTPAAQREVAALVDSFGLLESSVIVTDGLPSPLRRDGGPRANETRINVQRIAGILALDQTTPLLIVRASASVSYSATDASIVDAAIRGDRSKTRREDSLRSSNPSLFDGQDGDGLRLEGNFGLSFDVGNPNALTYLSSVWALSADDGSLQFGGYEAEIDPSLRQSSPD